VAGVYENAKISGQSVLIGGDWTINPISILGSVHHIAQCDTDKIRIGCKILTFDEWLQYYQQIGRKNLYTDMQIKEYKIIIDAIININKIS